MHEERSLASIRSAALPRACTPTSANRALVLRKFAGERHGANGASNALRIGRLDRPAHGALMNVNRRGATFTLVHARPLLADGALAVLTGSAAARNGQPGDALYAASKAPSEPSRAASIPMRPSCAGSSASTWRRRPRRHAPDPEVTSNAEVDASVEGLIRTGR